jgi:hypothetical protein
MTLTCLVTLERRRHRIGRKGNEMRPLTVFQPVDPMAPPLDLAADPGLWLPEGSQQIEPEMWTIPLRLGGLTRTVQCQVADPIFVGKSVWRRMRWTPIPESTDAVPAEKALPVFDGEIGLHRSDEGRTLVLNGRYDVPLGFLGETIDAVVMSRAARSTAASFLGEIAEHGTGHVTARPLTAAADSRSQ